MSLGSNLQYLRRLSKNMTQEALAEKLGVSRQTISKWEMDTALPEIDKAIELCRIFNCSLDNLFREEMDKRSDAYSNIRVEEVEEFSYVTYTVISTDPEGDSLEHIYKIAKENGVENLEGLEIKAQPKHRYAAIHMDRPFDNPFVTIPGAYQTLDYYMRVNGLVHNDEGVIPCFETDGESMDIYIACE